MALTEPRVAAGEALALLEDLGGDLGGRSRGSEDGADSEEKTESVEIHLGVSGNVWLSVVGCCLRERVWDQE